MKSPKVTDSACLILSFPSSCQGAKSRTYSPVGLVHSSPFLVLFSLHSNTNLNCLFAVSIIFVLAKSWGAGSLWREGPEPFPRTAEGRRSAASQMCSGREKDTGSPCASSAGLPGWVSGLSHGLDFKLPLLWEKLSRSNSVLASFLGVSYTSCVLSTQDRAGIQQEVCFHLSCIRGQIASSLPSSSHSSSRDPVTRSLSCSLLASNEGRFSVSQKQTLGSRWDGSGFEYLCLTGG